MTEKKREIRVVWDGLVPARHLERGFVSFVTYCELSTGL